MSKITIGIPTFQNHETVAETILSLKEQSFQDWECVIYDDSPDQLTIETARDAIQNDERFSIHKNERRLGAAANWNRCLDFAKTEYFKLLCADDILNANSLKQQISYMDGNMDVVMCCSPRDIISERGKTIIKNRGHSHNGDKFDQKELAAYFLKSLGNPFCEPSFCTFRTANLKNVNGFDNNWNYALDIATYYNVSKLGKIGVVGGSGGSFRVSATSWSSKLSKNQAIEITSFMNNIKKQVSGEKLGTIMKFKIQIKTLSRWLIFQLLKRI